MNSKDQRLIDHDSVVTSHFKWRAPGDDKDTLDAVRTDNAGADEGVKFQQIDFLADDYDHCNNSSPTITAVDGSGAVIFAKAIAVRPECGAGE